LDFLPTIAIIIFTNNQGYIALANNLVSYSCTKHIDICHHFIWEHIEQHEVELKYVSTKDMLADVFTKALPQEMFKKFCTLLGVLSMDG